MSLSLISICNTALSFVGASAIASLSDGSRESEVCDIHYKIARDAVLRSADWNFATKRITLSQLAEAPAYEYTYQYELPADYIRALETYPKDVKYTIEDGKLLSNIDDLKLKYIYRNENVSNYDTSFIQGFALYLAYLIAYPLVQSGTLRKDLFNEYKIYIADVIADNGMEAPQDPLYADTFVEARRGYNGEIQYPY